MLKIITGRARSGKSQFMIDLICKDIKNGKENIIYIVPNQFTLEAERLLIQHLKSKGLFQIQVLSFRRLIYRLQTELGGLGLAQMDDAGKAVLTNQVLYDLNPELKLYQNSFKNSAFSFSMSKIITECKQFGILPEDFSKMEFQGKLGRKMHDIEMVYSAYQSFPMEIVDDEDAINEVILRAKESELLKGASIYVDSFDVFTQQAYGLIEQMNMVAESITIALCTDFKNNYLFKLPNQTMRKLQEIQDVKPQLLSSSFQNNNIAHLEKNLFEEHPSVQPISDSSVELFTFKNVLSEVEHVCAAILQKHQEGYTFRDMALICNDLEQYGRLCEQTFKDNGINCFLDQKYAVSSSALAQFILNLLRTCAFADRSSYIAMIKQGFFDISTDEIELYENYVLAGGFRRIVLRSDKLADPDMNEIRKKVNYQPLQKKLNKAHTCGEMCELLLAYLDKLDIQIDPENNLEKEFYDKILGLLDTLTQVSAQREIDLPMFIDMLETGLEALSAGDLPDHADQLLIGDVSRSKLHEVKAIFIIGANSGVLPKVTRQDSLINDNDRKLMKNAEINLGRDTVDLISLERLLTYKMISHPKDYLWISCPLRGMKGAELIPSPLFKRILAVLPNCSFLQEDKEQTLADQILIAAPKIIKKELISAILNDRDTDFWSGIYDFYKTDPQVLAAIKGRDYDISIGENLASTAYKKTTYSPTRLETYYACPFKQFVRYGLNPIVRPLFKIDKLFTGSLYHEILDTFSKKLEKSGTLDVKSALNLVDNICDEMLPSYGEGIFENSNANRLLAMRIRTITKRAVRNMISHLEKDNFNILASELEFGSGGVPPILIEMQDGRVVEMTGKIDRVDIRQEDGSIRVIDYKSSDTKFDFTETYHGLRLQLLIYLNATIDNLKKDGVPSGMYYMQINESFKKESSKKDIAESVSKQLAESMEVSSVKLEGVCVSDKSGPESFDALLKFGKIKARAAIENIEKGEASIRPIKSGAKDSCQFCNYLTICTRGEDAYIYQPKKALNDILEITQKEQAND